MTESSDPQTPEVVAFAHAIRHAISESDGWDEFPFGLNLDQMVADVLATPEMQAIKAHIFHVANTCCDTDPWTFIRGSDLPQSVAEWVLS